MPFVQFSACSAEKPDSWDKSSCPRISGEIAATFPSADTVPPASFVPSICRAQNWLSAQNSSCRLLCLLSSREVSWFCLQESTSSEDSSGSSSSFSPQPSQDSIFKAENPETSSRSKEIPLHCKFSSQHSCSIPVRSVMPLSAEIVRVLAACSSASESQLFPSVSKLSRTRLRNAASGKCSSFSCK